MGQPRHADLDGVRSLIGALTLAVALCTLTAAEARDAAHAGAAMAAARDPYSVRPWVLWDRKDPLRAAHGRADLDAVIVETPYERVRYDGYLQALQGLPVDDPHVERWRREAAGRLGFVVYAHSRTGAEREHGFLARFSRAELDLPAHAPRAPAERAIFGPSVDFYDVGTFREERYTGSLTYRFADPPGACPRRGTLRFRDAQGRAYAFPFDIARFR